MQYSFFEGEVVGVFGAFGVVAGVGVAFRAVGNVSVLADWTGQSAAMFRIVNCYQENRSIVGENSAEVGQITHYAIPSLNY